MEQRLSHQEIEGLSRGMALLLRSGIGLGDGLLLLADQETGARRELLTRMGSQTDQGLPLSQTMEETEAFPAYVVGMVRAGEETGRLEESLDALADFYAERIRQSRQLRSAVVYPSILLLVMLAVVGVLLVKVLPVFDSVYASLGSRLTGVAGGLLQVGQLLEAALPVVLALLVAAVVGVCLFAGSASFRGKVLDWWNRSRGDKGVGRKQNNARFARALAMGLHSGLPLEAAARMGETMLGDVPQAAQRCQLCTQALEQGTDLEEALGDTGFLSPADCQMLRLGQRSGSQETVMDQVAERLSQEASQALEDRVAQVEPAMVLVSSLLVGVILLAVMLPLLNIMSAIG